MNSNKVASVAYKTLMTEEIKKKKVNKLSSEEIKKAEKFITVDEVPTFKECV